MSPRSRVLLVVVTSAFTVTAAATPATASPTLDQLDVDVRPTGATATIEATAPPAEGPAAITGADAWHAAGITGAGVKVGVIDFFDVALYWDESMHGPAPVAGANARCLDRGSDCTGDFFDGIDEGGEDHGVATVEAIREMAPGTQIYIAQASTISDYRALVDWFASEGVRIVNRSLGSRFDGPGDGRGSLGDVAASAVERGIAWINSAGNNAEDRYYRQPVRLTGTNVAFGPEGDDRFLEAIGCLSLGGMRWVNDWDRPAAERTDYDLYLWESPTGSPEAGQIVSNSRFRQTLGARPLEHISGEHCPTSGRTLYLEVRWVGGDIAGDVIEILDYRDGFAAHTQAEFSASVSIVDSDLAGVVSVGAIDPPDSGEIASYSSRGPTNDGRIAPDLTAPSGFASDTFEGRFAGTSASAAVASGAAALLLEARLATDATALGALLRTATIDRGTAGPDSTYGHGELRLPPPPEPSAPVPSRYVPLDTPTRILDTRPVSPIGPPALVGVTEQGETRRVPVVEFAGLPPDATSVAVNLISVGPDRRSFLQALPLWQATVGGSSNLNADAAGQNRANFAIVPIADDGTIALYSTAEGHLVVDVLGWFEPAPAPVAAGRFVELATSQRLLDTRTGGGAPVASGTTLDVPNPSGIPLGEVDALVITVTAVRPTSVGWLQAFPAARSEVVGATSTVNTSPGSTAASTAIVPIAAGGVAVHAFFSDGGTGHVLVDVIGYLTNASAPASSDGRYVAVTPARAFDSRTGGAPLTDGQIVTVDASTAPGVEVPDDARGVMWNLTVVNATRRGFLSGWAADAQRPGTSSLNWSVSGEVRAAAAVTAVSAGTARFQLDDEGDPASDAVGHLLVDVFGYFT